MAKHGDEGLGYCDQCDCPREGMSDESDGPNPAEQGTGEGWCTACSHPLTCFVPHQPIAPDTLVMVIQYPLDAPLAVWVVRLNPSEATDVVPQLRD